MTEAAMAKLLDEYDAACAVAQQAREALRACVAAGGRGSMHRSFDCYLADNRVVALRQQLGEAPIDWFEAYQPGGHPERFAR